MADAPITTALMPMDEFLLRQREAPFELFDGEIVPKMPTVSGHNRLAKRMFIALLPYETRGIGQVFQEATYVVTDSPQWVRGARIPDVMFVMSDALGEFQRDVPDADSKPFIVVPAIAIEIVSPTDQYSDIRERVRRYLNDGVRLIWVIDPQTREIAVSAAGSNSAVILSGDDVLTGADILPDFQLKVSEFFA